MNSYLLRAACCVFLVLVTGCTGAEVDDTPVEGRLIPVSFVPPVLQAHPATKGAPVALPQGATVRVVAYTHPEADAIADFSVDTPVAQAVYEIGKDGSLTACTVDDAGVKTGAGGGNLALRPGTYDFYAVSPARPLSDTGAGKGITGVGHGEDVMTSYAANVAVSSTSSRVMLAMFERQCARMEFRVQPVQDEVPLFKRFEVNALNVAGMAPPPVVLKAGIGQVITAGAGCGYEDARGLLSFAAADFELLPAADPDYVEKLGLARVGKAVLPKAAGSVQFKVKVIRNSGKVVELGAEIAGLQLEACQRYQFVLRVGVGQASLDLYVSPWNTATFSDAHVGEGGVTPPEPERPTQVVLNVVVWNNIVWQDHSGEGGIDQPGIEEGTGTNPSPGEWSQVQWGTSSGAGTDNPPVNPA